MDQESPDTGCTAQPRRRLGFRVLEMRTFWVSHLTHDGKGSAQISRRIRNTIRELAEGRVMETPALYVFESFATIDQIAMELRFQRRVKDGFLIGSFTHPECRFVGFCDDGAIQDLVPFAKRTGPFETLGKCA